MKSKTTQTQQVLAWLKRKGDIDPLTAWRRLGIYRLGARIYDLRESGVNIRTVRKTTRGGAVVALYKLA